MFGVRVAVREVRGRAGHRRPARPAARRDLGLGELRRVIAQHFLPRARVLQARSALAAVRALARRAALRRTPPIADQIDRHAERSRPAPSSSARSAPPTSWPAASVQVSDGERRELQTLLLGDGPPQALGLDDGAGPDRVRAEPPPCARSRAGATGPPTRWPNPRLVEVAEAAARTGESLYAAAVGS